MSQDEPATPMTVEDMVTLTTALTLENQRMQAKLQQYGFSVDTNAAPAAQMKPLVDANAAAHILISKGICTLEEWQLAVQQTAHDFLAMLLQAKENKRLALPGDPTVESFLHGKGRVN